MKNWGFRLKHKFIMPLRKSPMKYISSFFALLGGYFSLSEAEQAVLKTQCLMDVLKAYTILFLIAGAGIVLFLHREKLEHSEYLGMKDTMITLKMADLLNIKDSAIVIPTNTTFDTTMDNCFISDKSIQGQFQKRMYGTDFSELNVALKNSLEECYPDHFEILTDRIRTNEKRYDIGTVAKVTRQNQHYYFLAVADVSKSGKTENVTMANMTKALVGLWEYLAKEGHTEPITIPVIGTGRAGLQDGTFEEVIHETIFSFITMSQDEFISRKMTVCIYPPTLKDSNVTWERLCRYLDLECHFFEEKKKTLDHSNVVGESVE